MPQIALAVAILAAFGWLIVSALRGAWTQEQTWKAQDAAWTAARPESQPPDSATRRWLDLFGMVAGLAAVVFLVNIAHLNVVTACMLVAAPVLLLRQLRQRKREREAANRAHFGDYTPTFRERR